MGQHPPTGWKGYFIGRIMQTDEWQYQFLAETGTGITRQQQYNQNYSNQGRGESHRLYNLIHQRRANYHLSWRKR